MSQIKVGYLRLRQQMSQINVGYIRLRGSQERASYQGLSSQLAIYAG